MSFILMGQAMKVKVGSATRKLVLLKLCDQANDEGECWPSYNTIADQCELSRRAVIGHISALKEMGLLEVNARFKDNRSQSNAYLINVDALQAGGEKSAPSEKTVSGENPALPTVSGGESPAPGGEESAPPGGESPAPGGAPAAPRTYQLTNQSEPITEPKNTRSPSGRVSYQQADHDFSAWLALGVTTETIDSWLPVRKSKRLPVTPVVIDQFSKELQVAMSHLEFYSADDLMRECIAAGWAGIKASWLIKRISESNQTLATSMAPKLDTSAAATETRLSDTSWAR